MKGKQLKNSILQWAIQGKLVPQDPNDEPASVLLERIRAEKARLVKEGKIKKDKNESIIFRGEDNSYYEKFADGKFVCMDNEIPFEIPHGWEWCYFSQIIKIASNLVESSQYGNYKHIAPDNIEKGTGKLLSCNTVAEDKVISNNHLFYKGQIIYSKIRPLLRKCVIAPFDGLCSADMYPLNTSMDNTYILYILLSDMFNRQIADICASRVKMPKINQEELSQLFIPLPPLAEQRRIVTKVQELLPIVEQYGKAQLQLDTLNENIKNSLKKSILQEAIQGKLAAQNPNDEPAAILLEKIKKEKLRLVKEGKLKKKDLVDSVIYKGDDNKYYEKVGHKTVEITDEIPFDIPESWSWCRLKQCSEILYGYPFDSQRFNDAGLGSPVIRIRNVGPGNTNTYTDEPCSQRYLINPGDMLVGMDGNFNVQFWRGTPALLNQRVCRINANVEVVLQRFLYYYLPIAFEEIEKEVSFVTVKHLSDKHLTNQLVPIPPKQEQKRIIDKIDSLLNLIN